MKKSIFISMLLLMFVGVKKKKKTKLDTIQIKTSGQCGMCKERIEKVMVYEKGVKTADYDETTAVVTVIYNAQKTTPETLRKAITVVGHDADDQLADPKAYAKLPTCCKKPEDRNQHTGHTGKCEH
jgi:cation transport ATPase